jgi:hypothetical protein
MPMQRLILLTALGLISSGYATAKDLVPFGGSWEGSTVSATPVGENVVLVVSSGSGQASHFGHFEMTSPHLTFLDTGAVEGSQIFTAANGDTLTANISGQFVPNEDGNLEATLAGTITGGTGRFENASGSYDFHIIARPAEFGFDSTATFSGTISTVGSNKKT